MNKPFLPTDTKRVDPLLSWRRYATALSIAALQRSTYDRVAADFWGTEEMGRVLRAAVSPASTSGWGAHLVGTEVGVYLRSLRGMSAAARLFDLAGKVDLTGIHVVALPGTPTGFAAPPFVGEGMPIPVVQGAFDNVLIGPVRKLGFISVLTAELAAYSAEAAEAVIQIAMDEAAGLALDVALFSTDDASPVRPAGLLHDVTPIAATSGGGSTAMIADIANLVGEIADAGAGSRVVFVANPRQVVVMKLLAATGFDYEILATPAVPAGTVIAIDPGAIASAFSGLPELSITKNAVIHMENANPTPIGLPGSPNAIAAPIINGFQQDMLGLRQILRCAWVNRLPGAVQAVTGTSW